jgi:hypothetical protein
MDFIVGFPCTHIGHDAIWVIVDRLTKVAHFIPVRKDYRVPKLVDLYIEHFLRLHGVPVVLSPTKDLSSQPNSGRVCMVPWARLSTTAPLLTHRLMDRWKG